MNPDPDNPSSRLYTSPPDEAQRENTLQATVNTGETRDFNIHGQLHIAVASPERVTPAFAEGIAEWIVAADAAADPARTHPDDQDRLRAAYLVVRHGSEDTFSKHGARAIETLSAALNKPHDPFGPVKQLAYNPLGLAFAGLFHAHKRNLSKDLADRLVRVAASQPFDASVGAHVVGNDIAALDPRLSKVLVRTAFVAAIKPRPSRTFNEAKDEAALSRPCRHA